MSDPELKLPDRSRAQTEELAGERLTTSPPWLKLDYLGSKEEEGIVLHEHSLKIDGERLSLREISRFSQESGREIEMSQEDIDFLKNYDIELKVWTEGKEVNWYELMDDEDTCVTLFGEGLASNHQEWTNPGCSFMHNWFKHFKENLQEELTIRRKIRLNWATKAHEYLEMGIDDGVDRVEIVRPPKLISLAASCLGFGGSAVAKDRDVSEELVSDKAYARFLDITSRLLLLPQERTIGVGHSAGGEAMLHWYLSSGFEADIPVVALNPSLSLESQQQFRALLKLDQVGAKMPDLITEEIERRIIRWLMGVNIRGKLSPAEVTQQRMHQEEMKRGAFPFKLKELTKADVLSRVDPARISLLPLILGSSQDVTVSWAKAMDWVNTSFLSEHLSHMGLVLPELEQYQGQIVDKAAQYMITEVKSGHDAVFINRETQTKAIELVGRQMALQLASRQHKLTDIQEIFTTLRREQRVPLHLEYSESGQGMAEVLNGLYKVETLTQWLAAEKMAREWRRALPEDKNKLVEIPKPERDKFVHLLFDTHATRPYLEEKGIDLNEGIIEYHLDIHDMFFDRDKGVRGIQMYDWFGELERDSLNAIYGFYDKAISLIISLDSDESTAQSLEMATTRLQVAGLERLILGMKSGTVETLPIKVNLRDLLILRRLSFGESEQLSPEEELRRHFQNN